MKTATFSNGFTDNYKGKRDVKAAWMITCRETGKVLKSGHSLDRVRAQKTAETNAVAAGRRSGDGWARPIWRTNYVNEFISLARDAKKAGWDGKGSAKDFWTRRNAEINGKARARVIIEVVDI